MRFIKLMYLSDRKVMELYGFPISGDHYFSTWISDVADHKVEMWRTFSSVDELGELSPAEIESMDIIFGQYGGWDAFRLCDETHRICGECAIRMVHQFQSALRIYLLLLESRQKQQQ